MYQNRSFLAIIPARGGSKRLPKKNTLNLAGKPLISWTIEAALRSQYIDKVVVTSEDESILDISKKLGANIIKRPLELAGDTATTRDVVRHTVLNLDRYDYIVLLQPTSPLRNEKHIDAAIELWHQKKANAIISVCAMEHSPLWSNTLSKSLSMNNFLSDDLKNKRSQDLENYYMLNGAIYLCNTDEFLNENTLMLKENSYAYIMERVVSIDIDNYIDFLMCEFFIENEKILSN